ncbi:TPA: tetratricopeptide repeat protein, partial [Elizabethkingia anophelis]
MKIKTFIPLICLLIFLVNSCNSSSQEDYHKTFDLPLMAKSRELTYAGDYKELIKVVNHYYKIADQENYEEGKALCFIELYHINRILTKFEKSSYFLKKAEAILKDSDDQGHKAILYQAYVTNFQNLKMWDNAMYYSDKAIAITKNIKDNQYRNKILSSGYSLRGYNLLRQKKYDSGIVFLKKTLALDPKTINLCLLSGAFVATNRQDSALTYLKLAQNLLDQQKKESPVERLAVHAAFGDYYFSLKDYEKNENELYSALKYSKMLKGYYMPMELNKIFSIFYKTTGDKEKSKYYMQLYSNAKQKYYEEVEKVVNPAINKFIADVNEADQRHRNRMQITIGALVILCLLIGFYTFKQIRNIRRNRKKLVEKADQLKGQIGDKKYEEIIALAKKNDPKFLGTVKEAYPDFVNRLLSINPNLEESE